MYGFLYVQFNFPLSQTKLGMVGNGAGIFGYLPTPIGMCLKFK